MRREEREPDGGDDAAHERAPGRDGKRDAGEPLLGHRVAVERRHDRAGVAGDVEQDRRDAPAVFAADVDRGEQDERRLRRQLHRERDGQQDRHAVDRAQAGQEPDHGADEGAQERDQQVHGLGRDDEAVREVVEGVHQSAPSRVCPRGSVTSSILSKKNQRPDAEADAGDHAALPAAAEACARWRRSRARSTTGSPAARTASRRPRSSRPGPGPSGASSPRGQSGSGPGFGEQPDRGQRHRDGEQQRKGARADGLVARTGPRSATRARRRPRRRRARRTEKIRSLMVTASRSRTPAGTRPAGAQPPAITS